LPRIGEGWVMETLLFGIVSEIFPDTLHHASPSWLKPQHLDIYIPSIKLAIEYQGRQHFEPIDFFGGVEAFIQNQKRDEKKKKLCHKYGVKLLAWRYDTPVDEQHLLNKLQEYGVSF